MTCCSSAEWAVGTARSFDFHKGLLDIFCILISIVSSPLNDGFIFKFSNYKEGSCCSSIILISLCNFCSTNIGE